MTTRLRDHAPALLFATAGVWAMSFIALYGPGWNDYSVEVAPAYDVAEITALAAATMAWEYLCLLGGGL